MIFPRVSVTLVLSAILCERRIIFIADGVQKLAAAVNAANAMLYPFKWHYALLPVIPPQLIGQAAAPPPFIIGVRRYMVDRLQKEVCSFNQEYHLLSFIFMFSWLSFIFIYHCRLSRLSFEWTWIPG